MTKLFDKSRLYSRLEIEKIIDPKRGNSTASGSYYKINDVGVVFLKKYSIYNNEYLNQSNIKWDDSIGKRMPSWEKFRPTVKSVFFFMNSQKSPSRFILIGEEKYWKKLKTGEKNRIPNNYQITFFDKISEAVKEIFEDKKAIEKKDKENNNQLTRSFGATDPIRAKEIGDAGERIFNNHINGEYGSYEDVVKMIGMKSEEDFKWMNKPIKGEKLNESGKSYDFIWNKLYKIDIKTTTRETSNFYLSNNQKKLIEDNKLIIVLISIDKDYKYIKHTIINHNLLKDKFAINPLKWFAVSS